MENKQTKYYCRYCGTVVTMPEKVMVISDKPFYCLRCHAKGKKRKMLEVLKECTK